ncbi:hypothetical protein Bbelb_053100 [Branchiostoma belcheri]|nr:hypothetical protein Bbelb_053100 [Branchiostoma belcheri]
MRHADPQGESRPAVHQSQVVAKPGRPAMISASSSLQADWETPDWKKRRSTSSSGKLFIFGCSTFAAGHSRLARHYHRNESMERSRKLPAAGSHDAWPARAQRARQSGVTPTKAETGPRPLAGRQEAVPRTHLAQTPTVRCPNAPVGLPLALTPRGKVEGARPRGRPVGHGLWTSLTANQMARLAEDRQ